jgi:hypothetical protein
MMPPEQIDPSKAPSGGGASQPKPKKSETEPRGSSRFSQVWDTLGHLGLRDVSLRVGAGIALVLLVLVVVWVMGNFYLGGKIESPGTSVQAASPPTPDVAVEPPDYDPALQVSGVSRRADLHTILPARPRFDVVSYTVEKGDTIFGIAEKFNLKPSTILWGNYMTLQDNPHYLKPEMSLNILPGDGTYYEWTAADGLNGVAKYFGVTPETIINWPGNRLDPATIGDYSRPNIPPGTMLFVPGGTREFITWSAPRITRSDPAVAKVLGPGFCGTIGDGAVGIGTFIWPTPQHYVSGYNYSPETNHAAIDIGGYVGEAIYATDNGVVVYAGWNDHGYGSMIVVDHGGWQSLYAHLSAISVACGQSVFQGDVIGALGSTGNSSGPHLHFELRSDEYGRVDPNQFLPPP